MQRLWWLLEGYGSRKEKLLFVLTFIVLGLFILVVYLICQAVQGVQQIATDVPLPLDEDGNPIDVNGVEEIEVENQGSTNSYVEPEYN